MSEENFNGVTRRSQGGARTVLHHGGRSMFAGAVDYSAYFTDHVESSDPLAAAICRYAQRLGVEAVLIESGGPFLGMQSHFTLSPLSHAEVEAFRAAFKPSTDVDIDFL